MRAMKSSLWMGWMGAVMLGVLASLTSPSASAQDLDSAGDPLQDRQSLYDELCQRNSHHDQALYEWECNVLDFNQIFAAVAGFGGSPAFDQPEVIEVFPGTIVDRSDLADSGFALMVTHFEAQKFEQWLRQAALVPR